MKRHKHADLMHQKAEDRDLEIEVYDTVLQKWVPAQIPCWLEEYEYRKKPKTLVKYQWLFKNRNKKYWEGVTEPRTEERIKKDTNFYCLDYYRLDFTRIEVEE